MPPSVSSRLVIFVSQHFCHILSSFPRTTPHTSTRHNFRSLLDISLHPVLIGVSSSFTHEPPFPLFVSLGPRSPLFLRLLLLPLVFRLLHRCLLLFHLVLRLLHRCLLLLPLVLRLLNRCRMHSCPSLTVSSRATSLQVSLSSLQQAPESLRPENVLQRTLPTVLHFFVSF